MEGATTENALCCMIKGLTLGLKSLPPKEEQSARLPTRVIESNRVPASTLEQCQEDSARPG